MPIAARLLIDRVDEWILRTDTCWLWQAPETTRRAPMIYCNRKKGDISVRRYLYKHYKGVELSQNHYIVMSCDNPKCVNPGCMIAMPRNMAKGNRKQSQG